MAANQESKTTYTPRTPRELAQYFDRIYNDFSERVLHMSHQAISERNVTRHQLLRSAHVMAMSTTENISLHERVEQAVGNIQGRMNELDSTIRTLEDQYRQQGTRDTLTVLEKHRTRRRELYQDRITLEGKLADYNTPRDIYVVLHPVKNEKYHAIRVITPVPVERIRTPGTLSEQLVNLLYTEFVNDTRLGEGDTTFVHKVAIRMSSGRSYVGIDIIYEIDDTKLPAMLQHITGFMEHLISGADHPLRKDREVQRSSHLLEDAAFRLRSIISPLSYIPFTEQAIKEMQRGTQEIRTRAKDIFSRVLDYLSLERDETARDIGVEELLKQGAFQTEIDSALRRIMTESGNAFITRLNGMVEREIYPLRTPGEQQSLSTLANTRMVDGQLCVSLGVAARTMGLPLDVARRGYDAGTFRCIKTGTEEYVRVEDLLEPNKIVRMGHIVGFFNKPAMALSEFCNRYSLDNEHMRALIEEEQIPYGKILLPDKDGVPKFRGHVVFEEDTERILDVYQAHASTVIKKKKKRKDPGEDQ